MKTRKLIKRGLYDYSLVEWDGENESGMEPIGDHVLVLCDIAAGMTGGGLHLDDSIVEKQQLMADTGMIIAVGEGAWVWSADRTRPYTGRAPKPGDRVIFDRYAGRDGPGNDGRYYRIMTDKLIAGIFTPSVIAEQKIEDIVRPEETGDLARRGGLAVQPA